MCIRNVHRDIVQLYEDDSDNIMPMDVSTFLSRCTSRRIEKTKCPKRKIQGNRSGKENTKIICISISHEMGNYFRGTTAHSSKTIGNQAWLPELSQENETYY